MKHSSRKWKKTVNLAYLKNITSNPQFITRRDSDRRSYLKFPLHTNTKIELEIEKRAKGGRFSLKVYLARHNFTVDTTDVDTGIKTSLVVCINNITSKSLVRTNTTVVRSLNCIHTVNTKNKLFEILTLII